MDRAAAVIRAGGVVALPTDTLYGLAADPFNPDAVARLFALKGRTAQHAIPLIAFDAAQIVRHIGPLPPAAQRLADRFWPGPLTLLVNLPARPPLLAEAVSAGTRRVGVRVPAHTVARALCEAADTLLTATSANLSGQPPTDDPDVAAASIGDAIDILLDAGMTPGGAPSTIVDVTDIGSSGPRLIRAGAVGWDEVQACARLE